MGMTNGGVTVRPAGRAHPGQAQAAAGKKARKRGKAEALAARAAELGMSPAEVAYLDSAEGAQHRQRVQQVTYVPPPTEVRPAPQVKKTTRTAQSAWPFARDSRGSLWDD